MFTLPQLNRSPGSFGPPDLLGAAFCAALAAGLVETALQSGGKKEQGMKKVLYHAVSMFFVRFYKHSQAQQEVLAQPKTKQPNKQLDMLGT